VQLKNQPSLIKCLFKLHNFCIDEKERLPTNTGHSGNPPSIAEVHIEEEFNSEVITNRSEWLTEYQFTCEIQGPCLRETLADMILEKKLCLSQMQPSKKVCSGNDFVVI
jgi:hypothetical protein